ncbi:MAG: hypothetical protein AAB578_10510, partial [Elusimicrobiota bacterium]
DALSKVEGAYAIALLSPAPDADGICRVVNGKISIIGSVQDSNLASWSLEQALGENAVIGFSLISSGTVAISSWTLGLWDTSMFGGYRTLRLSALDAAGNRVESRATVFVGEPARLLALGDRRNLHHPRDVAVGADGTLYIADTNADRILVYGANGGLSASYGNNRNQEPYFEKPGAVEADSEGNIFVADTRHHRVVKLSAQGALLLEIGDVRNDSKGRKHFHSGSAPGKFKHPSGLALGPDGIYVSDTGNRRIQVFGADGAFKRAFALPPTDLDIERDEEDGEEEGVPIGIDVDAAGNVYVADPKGRRALRFRPDGTLTLVIGGLGEQQDDFDGLSRPTHDAQHNSRRASGRGVFRRPEGIAVSTDGSCIFVSDRKLDRIYKFDSQGNLTLAFGRHGEIKDGKPIPHELVFNKPMGLAIGEDGKLYAADRNNERIQGFGLPGPLLIASGGSKRGVFRTANGDPAGEAYLDEEGDPILALEASADPSFSLKDLYAFPNPARAGAKPVIHLAVGLADSVSIRIYDVSGRHVHEAGVDRPPAIINDGTGPKYAYEYAWDGHIPSGVYFYTVEAKKSGQGSIRKAGKLAVVR